MQNLILKSKPLLPSLRVSAKERKEIQELFDQSDAVCKQLAKYTRNHKQSINRHVMDIEQATSPSELDLPSFLQTLKAAEADFDVGRESVKEIQIMVQAIIEPCRYRIKECRKEMDERSQELDLTEQKIVGAFDESIDVILKGVHSEYGRQESERIAEAYKERRNARAILGAIGTVGAFVLGFTLAPFTAGGSVVVGLAAAAPSVVGHGAGVIIDHQQKERWKKIEEKHRSQIDECEERAKKLKIEAEACSTRIAKLTEEKDDLEKAVTILESFKSSLYQADEATVSVHDILEDKWHQLQNVMEVNAHQFICD